MLIKKIMSGGNDQCLVALPKQWVVRNNIKKGSYVGIIVVDDPIFEMLKEIKENGEEIVLESDNVRTKRGKIKEFVEDGVVLDTGFWMKISDIKKISKRRLKNEERI